MPSVLGSNLSSGVSVPNCQTTAMVNETADDTCEGPTARMPAPLKCLHPATEGLPTATGSGGPPP